jgi:hypothetical protein
MWGQVRGRATVEMHRQSALMMAESTKQMMRFWTRGLIAPPTRDNRNKRR